MADWLPVTFDQQGHQQDQTEKGEKSWDIFISCFPYSFLPSSLRLWQKSHPSEMLGPTNSPRCTLELALSLFLQWGSNAPPIAHPGVLCHLLLVSLTLPRYVYVIPFLALSFEPSRLNYNSYQYTNWYKEATFYREGQNFSKYLLWVIL